MSIKRRDFLFFLGASAGTIALSPLSASAKKIGMPFDADATTSTITKGKDSGSLSFKPIKVPNPLNIESLTEEQQIAAYSTYEVVDDVVLPSGFTYDIVAQWGDPVGDSRFGYNNDYLSFIETAPNEGYLTVNFEYISGETWSKTYPLVIKKSLPISEVQAQADKEGKINAFALPEDSPLKKQIKEISSEGLIDQGIGVIYIRRNSEGKWERVSKETDRRVTGISGLEDGRYLKATGPAVAIFAKEKKKGYDDGLAEKIIGTFQNCAGGTTPWGTVFSAEENFQDQVPEGVMSDGSSLPPEKMPLVMEAGEDFLNGRANVFGLSGNKYGYMVEIDPANPQDYGTKHTWLGRFRHEAVAFQAVEGKPLAVYSGCDRRGGHLYKFVSEGKIKNIKDKGNSRLLEKGMLYGAKFNPDGTGKWIALKPETPVNPVLPSQVFGSDKDIVTLPNPDRAKGGIVKINTDEEAKAFQRQFKTLGDLYEGDKLQKQGAILIDAHFAANAAGVTCTARPEDTEIDKNGTLYICFTSGTPGGDGGPDKSIFVTDSKKPYEYGWVMAVKEDKNDPGAMSFTWEMAATGGEANDKGAGFSNPDNVEIDANGNLWIVTDMSSGSHNKAIPSREKDGKPLSTRNLVGLFGNNSIWFIPTSGENAGVAYPFAVAPMDTESTGPFFTPDQQTLFLAIQHPGEINGIRQNMESQEREFVMKTTQGKDFMQKRKVPIGSNWPSKQANDPPIPAVIAIRKENGKSINS